MSVCRRVGAVVTFSTDWWACSGSRCTVVWQDYEDTNDAERLAQDPTMRIIVGRRGGPERPAASTNTMSRFETEVLTQDGNVEGLGRLNAKWVDWSYVPHAAPAGDLGHGQFGESGTWRTGGIVVQRSLWEHVLSPFVRVQPVRGLRGRDAPRGERT